MLLHGKWVGWEWSERNSYALQVKSRLIVEVMMLTRNKYEEIRAWDIFSYDFFCVAIARKKKNVLMKCKYGFFSQNYTVPLHETTFKDLILSVAIL